jgi:hypothetical protein
MSNAKTKLQSRLPRDIFEVLVNMPVDPTDPLVQIEDQLKTGAFDKTYEKKLKSSVKKSRQSAKIDLKEFKKICAQPLTWKQVSDHFKTNIQFLMQFAKTNKVFKAPMKRGRKSIPESKMTREEYHQRWIEKAAPSVEELDHLMVVYKGFIGMLAFKLEKSFNVTRMILKFRGVYKKWLSYNKRHCWETCGKS